MIKRIHWQPPSLCGCKLEIVADWVNEDGYRHPIPFTIQEIKIDTVCDNHKQYTFSMPDTSDLFDDISATNPVIVFLSSKNPKISSPSNVQTRGYLRYPITNPSPAECLYTYLAKHGGQIHRLGCGCQAHQWIDENKVITYLSHPLYTKKCHYHTEDTVDMSTARKHHDEYIKSLE